VNGRVTRVVLCTVSRCYLRRRKGRSPPSRSVSLPGAATRQNSVLQRTLFVKITAA